MKYKKISGFWGVMAVATILAACASISGAPGGGPKDIMPPVLLVSQPPQAAVDFQGGVVTMEFDEFIELRDQDKIYASPVLNRANYSYMLKKLKIEIEDTLRPDYTYTIRFGNSLVDLHEANPIPDFHYVFSTGSTIDSMFMEGRIVKAVDYKPEDRVSILIYARRPDSFPFDAEPDYVAIADKEGLFRVIHMKEGCYYVYGVMDENQDYRIDPVTEMMAYTDTCVPARKMVPVVLPAPEDTLALGDSVLNLAEADAVQARSDSVAVHRDETEVYGGLSDSLSEAEPVLELYLYRDYLPAFFLKEAAYKQRSQMEFSFYYPIDSIENIVFVEVTDSTETELTMPLEWQWAADRRSAVVYFPNYTLNRCDVIMQVNGYRDTASVYLADVVRSRTDTTQFQLTSVGSKLLESDTLFIRANFPSVIGDTGGMAVWRFIPLERKVTDTVWLDTDTMPSHPDTLWRYSDTMPSHSGLSYRLVDTVRLFTDTLVQSFGIRSIDPWTWAIVTEQKAGGGYALFMQDGAVFDFFGRPNDTAVFGWQVVEPEEGGDLALDLQGLEPGAVYVLQLVEGTEKIVREVRIVNTGMVEFPALKPAQYTFRLFKDDNDNGRWDEGDYVARRQPEKHWYYHKTLRVEADWRIEDVWRIE